MYNGKKKTSPSSINREIPLIRQMGWGTTHRYRESERERERERVRKIDRERASVRERERE